VQGQSIRGYQVLWQCGRFYFKEMSNKVILSGLKHIHVMEFIREMDLAYAAADTVVSRAGALSVSELSLVGKPVIFIPSPNVAEDHQTKNAMAYVSENAALLLKDVEAIGKLKEFTDRLFADEKKAQQLSENIRKMAKPDAAIEIVEALESIIE
jgi:UDP-N-acetylglucosamine--N-acetylmuramyl-(pentapeptide) pyrophosphoryl-undecaprenol N-acetylglucosamine transferase